MTTHPLAGPLAVETCARRIRHYRYAEERMMRIMGGWIALTPELPAKLVFGRHVWDCAQHADAWGKRLPELREPAQQSEPSNDRFVRFMDLLESAESPGATLERLTGVYGVLKPHLIAAYARHLEVANPIYEPPTRRILERCLGEERRHVAAGAIVLGQLAAETGGSARVSAWERRLLDALGEAGGVTGQREVPITAPVDSAGVRTDGDLVALGSRFDRDRLEPEFLGVVDAHRRAIAAREWARVGLAVAPEAQLQVLAEYEKLDLPCPDSDVVACAKIGRYRMVKLGFSSPRGASVIQLRWRRSDDVWRVVEASLIRTDSSR